jgi:hypothetical protein
LPTSVTSRPGPSPTQPGGPLRRLLLLERLRGYRRARARTILTPEPRLPLLSASVPSEMRASRWSARGARKGRGPGAARKACASPLTIALVVEAVAGSSGQRERLRCSPCAGEERDQRRSTAGAPLFVARRVRETPRWGLARRCCMAPGRSAVKFDPGVARFACDCGKRRAGDVAARACRPLSKLVSRGRRGISRARRRGGRSGRLSGARIHRCRGDAIRAGPRRVGVCTGASGFPPWATIHVMTASESAPSATIAARSMTVPPEG